MTLLTLKELDIFGVLVAPIALYAVVGIIAFLIVRAVIGRLGFYRFVWHPSLFDLALCISFVSLVTIFATHTIG